MKTRTCLSVVTAIAVSGTCLQQVEAGKIADIMKASGVCGGVAVVVGCDDIATLTEIRQTGPFLVHGLDSNVNTIARAREQLRGKKAYGAITVAKLENGLLPFIDNTVNLVVVVNPLCGVPQSEIRRVLAPRGVHVVNPESQASNPKWTKPVPAGIDDWPQYLYDASNNAVSKDTTVAPPQGLQWTCGPRYARSHEHFGSVCAMVSTGGRIFYIHDNGPISSVFLPPKWELVARDAFNGVLLWKHPIGAWESQLRGFRSGPPEIGRRMVAGGGKLYVALGYGEPVTVLDPLTGKELAILTGTERARELLYAEGKLYILADDMTTEDHEQRKKWFNDTAPALQGYGFPGIRLNMYGRPRVVACDTLTNKPLWSKAYNATGEIMPATLAVADGRVCFQTVSHVVCLEAESGKEAWRADRPVATSRFSWATPTLVMHDAVILSGDRMPKDNIRKAPGKGSEWVMDNHHQMNPQPGEVIAFALKDGKELWRAPSFENYTIPMDIFVVDGAVWTGHIRSKAHPGFTNGLNLHSGKPTAQVPHNKHLYGLQMGHNRCYRNRATTRFLLLGRDGVEFVDFRTGVGSGYWWVRGTCQYGIMPANGLIYAPVNSCACHPQEKLNGFNTLSSVSALSGRTSNPLEKGPAYGKTSDLKSRISDWPTYRCDTARGGHQDITAPSNPKLVWTTACAAPLTPPVCANGLVYVAEKEQHTIRAIDVKTGRPTWTFIADGRIDSPPTIDGGFCLFGTRSGFVYSLRASDGELAWRFRAAPDNRLLCANGQLESAWPVHGSVLVAGEKGKAVAYFAAGRTPHLDGGIRLYGLDVATAEKRYSATVSMVGESEDDGVIAARVLTDILTMHDGNVFMRDMCLDRALKPLDGKPRHLYAPGGFLDDSWWHRTYWIYGTTMMSGYGGWPKTGNVTPSGRLLVDDGGDVLYGYGRMAYRAGAGHVSPNAAADYKLFAELRSPKPMAETVPGKGKKKRGPRGRREFKWNAELPFVARAMVLSRDAVVAAGGKTLPEMAGRPNPGTLRAVSRVDGKMLVECALTAPPVLDGMALTGDGILVSTVDGRIVCLK